MANETRVNLKHLLEDLRDAYASPVEEVIVTELVANALDSGATQIRLEAHPSVKTFRCIDNGTGMNRAALRSYHNIAASTKERGEGIGFAGVGAKLSLLVAETVVTETRGKHGAQGAAEWFLKNAFRAPWKFIAFSGLIESGKGTAVTIVLKDVVSPLLDERFLIQTIQRHFYPLISHQEAMEKALRNVYKKPISIQVNNRSVRTEDLEGKTQSFVVHRASSRKVIGAGFIQKAAMDENFWSRLFGRDTVRPTDNGLRISTYGKVIRGGWEWLGIPVKHPDLLSGVVEVPGLSEILTTNKSDFLSTPGALKKYYEIRKDVQRAVMVILQELGEVEDRQDQKKTPTQFKPLTDDIEGALSLMTESFPGLEALVGEHWRRKLASVAKKKRKRFSTEKTPSVETVEERVEKIDRVSSSQTRSPDALSADAHGSSKKREREPGLEIAFENFTDDEALCLGKLVTQRVVINTAHPAWSRAQRLGQEPYHVLMTVAMTLAQDLQPPNGMYEFVSEFLKAWSEASEKSGKLL
ncbi:MAG TPA: ATP-binding protein [Patescibacteria group bacterium]|nr:ATP-binding protein [Patescibacteria group bacterium]